jgi:hypothetical protein
VKGAAYAQQLIATGGKPPYNWSIVAGSLPAGLGVNSDTGAISGNPTAVGTFSFTADVTDIDLRSARKALFITVVPVPLSFVIASPVEAVKGVAFNYQLNATGGTAPYTWAVTGGGLPAGLALNAEAGAVTGAASVSGTFIATITVRDQDSQAAAATLQIKVTDPESVPRITSAVYKKSKKKLTVNAERVDAAARLRIDGRELGVSFKNGAFVVKRITFSRGEHTLKITNSNGESSAVFILTVN